MVLTKDCFDGDNGIETETDRHMDGDGEGGVDAII